MDGVVSSKCSFLRIGIGAIALLMALYHFWAGPFSPQPTLEEIVVDKAVSIKEKTIARLIRKEPEKPEVRLPMNADDKMQLTTAILGGLAVIFGVVGIAFKNPLRIAGGSIFLGAFAIAFQFAAYAVGMLVVAILVSAVVYKLDFCVLE